MDDKVGFKLVTCSGGKRRGELYSVLAGKSHGSHIKSMVIDDLNNVLFVSMEDDSEDLMDLVVQSYMEELEEECAEEVRRTAQMYLSINYDKYKTDEYTLPEPKKKLKPLPYQFSNTRKGKQKRW